VADLKARSLGGRGTDESVWLACSELHRLGVCSVRPPDSCQVVVVAPHPDDEVLGAGGITATLPLQSTRIVWVAVTDGEASAPERAEELRRLRPRGSARAAASLGMTLPLSYALGLPDGRVCARGVETLLASLLEPGDLVLAPWAHDGHPDHDELGRAAQRACAEADGRLVAYLAWAWHWAQPDELPWEKACRVGLDDVVAKRKRKAVQCFAPQLTGPEPILSSSILRQLTRDFGVFLSP
jgi:LmbE family N-acetylglucosaminyl deacetylase